MPCLLPARPLQAPRIFTPKVETPPEEPTPIPEAPSVGDEDDLGGSSLAEAMLNAVHDKEHTEAEATGDSRCRDQGK